ncbi:hypothetical protein FP2506_15319 [Fulvimarina pelagi HTCC2506]|uniref:DUF1902 domain-containing protein n=1 Tax=Fulvimarina pelagi HTCC2506 TaxID=314231 RepID=Q0G3L6_9HYPH|nr:DUF1902 domain-containing protein [Fulvimarina pelagi]EAU41815.1 hypothetical protein FP2506_15319 [Fulvimarina pelagi HTCC2506]
MQRSFTVKAVWDDEAKVFVCESDIDGLHIEAETLDAFEDLLYETAVELIVANHVSADDLATKPLKDLIPAIVWQRPGDVRHAA